jgi:molybdenum-dependent DNA-binding transcriptional regulator ModE
VRATDWQKLLRLIRSADIFSHGEALAAHMPTGKRAPPNLRIAMMNRIHLPPPNSVGSRVAKGVIGVARAKKPGNRINRNSLEVYTMAISNMPIDSRQLRAFAALARTGSFTIAAKKLFLSQSAVSHSMKALETDVGCRLFDRVGKKVSLTQAGETLLHHAEKILGEMQNARSALYDLGKWGRGRLRIGASTTACQYILPPVLRQFKESFPADAHFHRTGRHGPRH